ncbi:hypothetical protein [Hyphomonas sp.]|uniref:hypothetical protein n=1 Tax=Hyphomonas sp. TaxID=87 RepID=UPI003F6F9561
MRVDFGIGSINICPPKYHTGANRCWLQNQPGFFAAVNADAGTNCRTFNCLLHLLATQHRSTLHYRLNLYVVQRQHKTRLVSAYYKKGCSLRYSPVKYKNILQQSGVFRLHYLSKDQ